MSNVATPAAVGSRPSKGWNIALWVVQVLLAAAFGMAGVMKSTAPIPELVEKMVWPGALPPFLVRFIGVAELLAAIGMLLPAATRIKPILTPLAGIGLAVIQILAIVFHISRGEMGALPFNFTLCALAALVAWGRLKKAPIQPR